MLEGKLSDIIGAASGKVQKMIELKGISKTYFKGRQNQVNALTDIDLTIEEKQMTAVIGPSGAGKSTLLHILALLETPDAGSYKVDGEDVTGLKDGKAARFRNKKIAYVMQNDGLIGRLTAFENAALPLTIAGERRGEIKERVNDALTLVGLEKRIRTKTEYLSGGEAQRVAIARAVASGADIILADEPTGAVDTANSEKIVELFRELNNRGKTVIIVTHNRDVAAACDRVVEIVDGRIADPLAKGAEIH